MDKSTYGDCLNKLYRLNTQRGVKLGLDRMSSLAQALGEPQGTFSSVHIAGTNGKGSVATKVANALRRQGYRVGLYTSPHISSFRERIRIDGAPISEAAVVTGLDRILSHADLEPTFFEATTALAFEAFRDAGVEWAVVETGLGGRLDATNIIEPEISAITSISFDHTDILGDTLEKIAAEKAGIMKPGVPVVIGPYVNPNWMQARADELRSQLVRVAPTGDPWTDADNTATARVILDTLVARGCFHDQPRWTDADLAVRPPCRFERIAAPGSTILDVAHNPDGIQRLLEHTKRVFGRPVRAVLGMSANKDKRSCLNLIEQACDHIYLLKVQHQRLAPPEELQRQLSCASTIVTPDQLPQLAREAATADEVLLVFGSFFIMSAARQAFGIQEPIDPQDLNECFDPQQNLMLK